MMELPTEACIGGFNDFDTIDADGVAFAIFFQGCKKRCPGCHNPGLQPFGVGEFWDVDEILAKIRKNKDWYKAVVFVGGEPLDQVDALFELMVGVKEMGLERWLYTGYREEQIPAGVFALSSVIVAGEWVQELATGGFPASSNQVVIDRRS